MTEEITYPIRINRYLELRGVTTRRGADELISAGLVTVNGRRAVLGEKVNKEDKVEVKPNEKTSKKFTYVAYHKPRGLATEEIKKKGLFPVGRLDKESEGLIILTDDGRVTERLLSPRFEHEKEYVVRVRESAGPMVKRVLEKGVVNAGEKLVAKEVEILTPHELRIILTSGKKHQIRRMLDEVHLTVESLERVRIMDIELDDLQPGGSRFLSGKEKENFLKALGIK